MTGSRDGHTIDLFRRRDPRRHPSRQARAPEIRGDRQRDINDDPNSRTDPRREEFDSTTAHRQIQRGGPSHLLHKFATAAVPTPTHAGDAGTERSSVFHAIGRDTEPPSVVRPSVETDGADQPVTSTKIRAPAGGL